MKKNRFVWRILSVILIFILIFLVLFFIIQKQSNYIKIINSNWNLNLPTDMNETFSVDSGASFLGDGIRYHVFEIKSPINNKLNWSTLFLDLKPEIESKSKSILESLEISENYYPDLDEIDKYYYIENDDSSKLYILFNGYLRKIYVIEYIK